MGLFQSKKPAPVIAATGYVPVALDTLLPARDLPFDLFVRQNRQAPYTLYRQRQLAWQADDVSNLRELGVRTLYIDTASQDTYSDYLRQAMLDDSQLDYRQRYQILKASTHALLQDAFSGSEVTAIVRALDPVAEQIMHCVSGEEVVFREVFSLMAHDYSTYTHANNVATLCVALGIRLGISDKSELSALACGALLHDLGKRQLPASILNKRQRLSEQELVVVRRHPQLGFEELCQLPTVTWPQLMMVYQHHERMNGTGYPARIEGSEIHLWARICAVADAFNAMTSQRPYRPAMDTEAALTQCQQHSDRIFDREIVECLTSLVSNN